MSARTLLLALALVSSPLAAQTMTDPTRPPNAAPTAEGADGTLQVGPVLQSVIITPKNRIAIIDGQRVPLGGKFGEGRVVRISDSEVAVRYVGRTEVLKLYPGIDIQPRHATPRARKPRRERN